MQFLRRSLAGLLLLSVTFGLLSVAGSSFYTALQERLNKEAFSRPARERVYAVNTLVVEAGPVTPVITAFGEVQARSTLDLRASAGGRLVWLADEMKEGAFVEAGTLLARIDPTDAQAALDVARSQLAEAEAELRDAERALDLARDELIAAREQADLRSGALIRQQDLQQRGVGTAAAVENAALANASADAQVLSRRQALAQAESRLDLAGTRMDRQRIAVANAERDVADTEIRTALSGVLNEVAAVQGGLVTANERVAQVIDPMDLEVAFRLSTAQYGRLLDEQGQLRKAPVGVMLDVAGIDLNADGQLDRVGAAVGEGQTGRQVFARIGDAAGLRPGDFVTVTVREPRLDDVSVLPAVALGSDSKVLGVGEEGRLTAYDVELLRRQGDDVVVRADALVGQEIVAERIPLLGEGVKVRVIGAEGAQPAYSGGRPGGPSSGGQQGGRPSASATGGGGGWNGSTGGASTGVASTGGGGGSDMIALSDDRRARLIAFVEGNGRLPAQAKERMLAQLAQPEVPAQVIARIESRMGG